MSIDDRQRAKARRFRTLHESGTFVMPCAWDAGSARMFEHAGFEAIGTTSGGVNWSHARPDYVYAIGRDTMLDAYQQVVDAVDLPVSGDLENGYGTESDEIADTIRAAINRGMVGGSIEDQATTLEPGLVPIDQAADNIAAARQVADSFQLDFTLTARPESFFGGIENPFDDAVERANRYFAAGADCVFVPGLTDLASIQRLVEAVDGPVSVGIGSGGGELSVDALRDIGVRRISTGGAIPRALYAAIAAAGEEMRSAGTFSFTTAATDEAEINRLFT